MIQVYITDFFYMGMEDYSYLDCNSKVTDHDQNYSFVEVLF